MSLVRKRKRKKVYDKYDGHCAYCGAEIDYTELQVDHIIPRYTFTETVQTGQDIPHFLKHLTEYDVDHIDNLNPSCRVCNKWKAAFPLEWFREDLQNQLKKVNVSSSNYRMALRYRQVIESPKPIIFYFETRIHRSLEVPIPDLGIAKSEDLLDLYNEAFRAGMSVGYKLATK